MMHSNEDMEKCRMGRGRWVKIPFIIAAVVLIKSTLIFYLWNALVPDLFHGPELTFVHAMGLMILGKLLFGGMGHHHGGPFGKFGRFGGFRGRHHPRFDALSKEEREALREMIRERSERSI